MEPLVRDVAHRWKLLMGQEGLVLGPTGEIRLRRGSLDLESADMSGGERAVAGIVVRLLVAASATRIPTCWYDEPLEHLDPRATSGSCSDACQCRCGRDYQPDRRDHLRGSEWCDNWPSPHPISSRFCTPTQILQEVRIPSSGVVNRGIASTNR